MATVTGQSAATGPAPTSGVTANGRRHHVGSLGSSPASVSGLEDALFDRLLSSGDPIAGGIYDLDFASPQFAQQLSAKVLQSLQDLSDGLNSMQSSVTRIDAVKAVIPPATAAAPPPPPAAAAGPAVKTGQSSGGAAVGMAAPGSENRTDENVRHLESLLMQIVDSPAFDATELDDELAASVKQVLGSQAELGHGSGGGLKTPASTPAAVPALTTVPWPPPASATSKLEPLPSSPDLMMIKEKMHHERKHANLVESSFAEASDDDEAFADAKSGTGDEEDVHAYDDKTDASSEHQQHQQQHHHQQHSPPRAGNDSHEHHEDVDFDGVEIMVLSEDEFMSIMERGEAPEGVDLGQFEAPPTAPLTEFVRSLQEMEELESATSDASAVGADLAHAKAEDLPMQTFHLPVIYRPLHTGFETEPEPQYGAGDVIADRFVVRAFLGSAAFSSALSCVDQTNGNLVCLKMVKNDKHYFDQSLDEIKLLILLNSKPEAAERHILRMYEYFYYSEHLFIVTELLKDNLYEFQKFLLDNELEPYFTIPRLQRIARQILEALDFIHGLKLLHCDLKPENILIKSYSGCDVKLIDFGSSSFSTDHVSSYIQSRSYRAPEVILDAPFNTKIDIWSLGCVLYELFTAKVLFANDSVQTILCRIASLKGAFPEAMLEQGRAADKYFTPTHIIYEHNPNERSVLLYRPTRTMLKTRMPHASELFVDLVDSLLTVDPTLRPSAAQALRHPFFQETLAFEPYVLPP